MEPEYVATESRKSHQAEHTSGADCPSSTRSSPGQHASHESHRGLSYPNSSAMKLPYAEAVGIKVRALSVVLKVSRSWFDLETYRDIMVAALKVKATKAPCRTKVLLQSVVADIQPGTLTAIIGESSSGKSTLLNTLAERVAGPRWKSEGLVTFNGQQGIRHIRHAYVMQDDILLESLTVRETLCYAAELGLSSSTSAQERIQMVEEIIRGLGLKACADTRIGGNRFGGCSGGEKRRVSLGIHLLTNPSGLFLDEPTTGLDATTAFQIVRLLQELAKKGRTVITTIHQPRIELWNLLDNLLVLSRGALLYSGPTKDCLPWFSIQGFPLPSFVNPAEHIIEIVAVDTRTSEAEEKSVARVEGLKAAWQRESSTRFKPLSSSHHPQHREPEVRARHNSSFFCQLSVLTSRTLKLTYRDPLGMFTMITEAILMGIITGCIFFNLDRDLAGIRSRQGFFFIVACLQGFLIVSVEVYRMTIDIRTFDREASDSRIHPLAFLLSRRLARTFTEDIPVPLLFSILVYFMANLERTASKFFVFFGITLVNHYVAVTCAMTCVVAIRNFAGASLLANMVFFLQSFACGMFIQINTMPVYVQWTKWITYTFYSFSAYNENEFHGNFYDCPESGSQSSPSCRQYAGGYVLESLGFPGNWTIRPIIVLVCFVILFLTLSAIGLRFFKRGITIAHFRAQGTGFSSHHDRMTQPSARSPTINVRLHDFSLSLNKTTAFRKSSPIKTVLHPTNAEFQAGALNVIMGPSGSGKTLLLNAIALRLRSPAGSNYRGSGKITFNGVEPSESVIRVACSYVCQDDDALSPYLTVRETLRFAAGLRLPSFMSKDEKILRSEEVLVKMGLKGCADSLIGNERIKGISGGEKRRVSIAVQLLTEPNILLLDEPTSGLDTFTASSVIEALQTLAQEGRTVILSIHQARSSLFSQFQNVLLLAHGGFPVYVGSSKGMLPYFLANGYDCPQNTNPADFALDLVSADRQEDSTNVSLERVRKLVLSWRDCDPAQINKSKTNVSKAPNPSPGETPTRIQDADQNSISRVSKNKLRTQSPHQSPNTNMSSPADIGSFVHRGGASFRKALPLLLSRSIINIRRQPEIALARTMQAIGFSIIIVLFFAPLQYDYYSVQSHMGFIQQLGTFYIIGMLQNVAVYPTERDTFYGEDADNVSGVNAFLASYTILEVPFEMLSCFVFSMLAVVAVGLPHTATMFFVCTLACFSIMSCGESIGIIFNTLFDHTGFAVNIMGVFLSVANAMAGVLSINMPKPLKALNYLSPSRYATRSVAWFALREARFSCTKPQQLSNGKCHIETGMDVLKLYQFDANPKMNLVALVLCFISYRIVAWVVLKVARMKKI